MNSRIVSLEVEKARLLLEIADHGHAEANDQFDNTTTYSRSYLTGQAQPAR